MDPLTRLNEAIQHLETHLLEEPDYQKLASIAGCSEYHLKRMFPFLVGETISGYIRMRRLSRAAEEVREGDAKIIDLAQKYGYHSSDAFTRAFSQFHGVTPSGGRADESSFNWYPPVSLHMTIRGGMHMNYRMTQLPAFQISGVSKRVSIQFEGENPEIAAMWQSLTGEKIEQLLALSDLEPKGLIQASANFSEGRMDEQGQLDQYIGTATTKDVPDAFDTLPVSGSQWAVFTSSGPFPETLQNTWGRIYSDWFPTAAYELAEGPEMLVMLTDDLTAPEVESEIWIPVRPKPE